MNYQLRKIKKDEALEQEQENLKEEDLEDLEDWWSLINLI